MSTATPNHDGRTVRDRSTRRVALDTIGPQRVGDVDVVMRRARISDGPAWRRVRLDDEPRLRPALADGEGSWDEQSSLTSWVEHVAWQRSAARAGTLVPFLVATTSDEVLGECTFALDARSGLAELSLWSASTVSHAVTRWATANGVLRLFDPPRAVPWVIAPVAVPNTAPVHLLELAGFQRSGTSRQLRHYDGVPTDHDVWRLENTAATRAHLRTFAGPA